MLCSALSYFADHYWLCPANLCFLLQIVALLRLAFLALLCPTMSYSTLIYWLCSSMPFYAVAYDGLLALQYSALLCRDLLCPGLLAGQCSADRCIALQSFTGPALLRLAK